MNPPPDPPLSDEERQALLWFRVHGPAEIDAHGAPRGVVRVALIRRGLLGVYPPRAPFGAVRCAVTDPGMEICKHV
ncbi:hypothetical protein JQ581_30145 [Bradyrhizobium liaoningense]|uniref:hypothetical protein n=1 Tax=Bradyrhizobium liaoningense TaxID=43992 RepID=UPI001BAD1971|nr:hypothetical protein [Bradyrhizobium liaoningense]MBR0741202.1 hypothetical protein [Bradyrhizobium liaoningense]